MKAERGENAAGGKKKGLKLAKVDSRGLWGKSHLHNIKYNVKQQVLM